jgi:hypothetical protein
LDSEACTAQYWKSKKLNGFIGVVQKDIRTITYDLRYQMHRISELAPSETVLIQQAILRLELLLDKMEKNPSLSIEFDSTTDLSKLISNYEVATAILRDIIEASVYSSKAIRVSLTSGFRHKILVDHEKAMIKHNEIKRDPREGMSGKDKEELDKFRYDEILVGYSKNLESIANQAKNFEK